MFWVTFWGIFGRYFWLYFCGVFWGHLHNDFEYSFGYVYEQFFVVFHESKYDIWPVGHFRVYKLCIFFTNILSGIQLRLIRKIGNDDVRHIYTFVSVFWNYNSLTAPNVHLVPSTNIAHRRTYIKWLWTSALLVIFFYNDTLYQ